MNGAAYLVGSILSTLMTPVFGKSVPVANRVRIWNPSRVDVAAQIRLIPHGHRPRDIVRKYENLPKLRCYILPCRKPPCNVATSERLSSLRLSRPPVRAQQQ